jgi:asparagine synthase (glutamine-hydrolysing)
MCGLVGIISLKKKPIDPYILKDMCDIVAYRGPDDAGYALMSLDTNELPAGRRYLELTDDEYINKNVNLASINSAQAKQQIVEMRWHVALGHRRLSIIDLSARAHQPMSDCEKKIWITYTGEIYNFKELRQELETAGYSFNSRSETEVIINSYKQWGIECVNKFNGMFAFALWDGGKNKLFLARDRYGIKPLYYHLSEDALIFGSEIKSILKSRRVDIDVDLMALNEYFTFQNIFSDRTMFKNIHLLPPGCYAELKMNSERPQLDVSRYWDYHFSAEGFKLSRVEAAEEILRLFKQAVQRQLVSDVPVGSYLSGGIDTGSITAIVRKYFGRISTFTCGFDLSSASGLELGYDERQFAEYMANMFKTEHYEVVLHAGDMEAVMPELIWHLEDPRVGQCYPNFYVARLAGKFVKVVLSGAGGDELFGGYPWRYYRGINVRDTDDYKRKYYDYWQRLVVDEEKGNLFQPDIFKRIKDHSTYDVFSEVFLGQENPYSSNEDFVNASMYFEIKTFLHGLFVIEDKISLANALETRVPFMDNDLVDFAMKIPVSYKLNSLDKMVAIDEDEPGKLRKYYQSTNDGKTILRQAMGNLIPREIIEREKQGFSAPDASWFRGDSIDYVKQLLLDPGARIYKYLDRRYVGKRIKEHMDGKFNHRLFIWSLLSFEWWNNKFINAEEFRAKPD